MAPLTAIFLIAEMSNGYELIVPLMLSTSIAYLIAKKFNKHSIFTQKLVEQGDMYQYKDMTVVKQIDITKLLENDLLKLESTSNFGNLIELIKQSPRNLFIVNDSNDNFVGVIILDNVRKDMFDRSKYNDPISNYLYIPQSDEKADVRTDARDILNKFKKTNNYNMIILDDKRYIGIVSRANLLKEYRENMISDIDDR